MPLHLDPSSPGDLALHAGAYALPFASFGSMLWAWLKAARRCRCRTGPEWSGYPNPRNPDNEWVCDDCGRVIPAKGGAR